MQPKYFFGKHCKVCEKMSLLEAFLSHHYRFLVERQVQQDSVNEQKAGRAISAKLESIPGFFVNSHSGISQFSIVEKGQSDAPPSPP